MFACGYLGAVPPSHAPLLSVHESSYGTISTERGPESIETLDVRIVSHDSTDRIYRVECLFLKKGKHGAPPVIDDAAVFDVTRPHATYRVTARPIPLKSPKNPSCKSKGAGTKNPGAKGRGSGSARPPGELLREGYVVRVSSAGEILRECFSSPSLAESVRLDPGLLDPVMIGKHFRELDPVALTVR